MSNAPFLFVPTFSWPAAPFGLLYSYQAGSTTPKSTFSDAAGLVPNTNPVELDATGSATVRLGSGSYKFVLLDQTNTVTLWTQDNYDPALQLTDITGGATLVTYPAVAGEVGVTNMVYPYGCPRRYGAQGDGVTDDTTAVQNAITSAVATGMYYGWPNDAYGVTTVTWPDIGHTGATRYIAKFNGSKLVGIATNAQSCISHVKSNFTTFYDYLVDGGTFNNIVPNSNYTCGTWWFNGVTSGTPVGNCQNNTFYGMTHVSCTRGLVYGGLPTLSSTTATHSENKIYSFQSVGVSNPFYGNSSSGFLHVYGSTFFRDVSTWTTPTMPTTGRAVENVAGSLYINGGEIIASNSQLGFAADLYTTFVENTYIELAAPIQVYSSCRFDGCDGLMTPAAVSMFKVNSAAVGVMTHYGCHWAREPGVGASDRTPLVDGSAAPTYEVIMDDCETFEWGFVMAAANVKLIQGCVAAYSCHRLQITDGSLGGDSNVYRINSKPRLSIIPELTTDHLGYTTTGWTLVVGFGAGTTLANSTSAGPTNFLASQLKLHATGSASALTGDPTSLTTCKATMQRVTPKETFWLSSWVNMGTGGSNAQLVANFYDLTGASVSTLVVADNTSVGSNAWVFAEGPAAVPATAAYAAFGWVGTTSDVLFTDFRVQRA